MYWYLHKQMTNLANATKWKHKLSSKISGGKLHQDAQLVVHAEMIITQSEVERHANKP